LTPAQKRARRPDLGRVLHRFSIFSDSNLLDKPHNRIILILNTIIIT
jgi:hypothetical protein